MSRFCSASWLLFAFSGTQVFERCIFSKNSLAHASLYPMNGLEHFSYPKLRLLFLAGGLLLMVFLQACSTYSSTRESPTRTYSYQPRVSYHESDHGYYSNYYYGRYQPGWFISAGYAGAYSGAGGYAPLAYWPSYSPVYYRNAYDAYYDPWYYSYSRNSGYPYSYGSGYGAGYRYGNPYSRSPYYGSRPYYGNIRSYRPPGENQQPGQNRPDPVLIPPDQRGLRGASDEDNQRVTVGLRQREAHQPDRRSVAVVNEERDMSRSVGLAPTQAGDQGMTISNRSERKVRASRLEPVGTQIIDYQTIDHQPDQAYGVQNGKQRANNTQPVQLPAPAIPIRSGRGSRSYQSPTDEAVRAAPAMQNRPASPQATLPIVVPPARSETVYRQAPAPKELPSQQPNQQSDRQPNRQNYQQQPAPRNAPDVHQRLDSSNVRPTADRRQVRETERERERERQNR